MKKILLLCGCQSYFGVDLLKRVFEEQEATIDSEPPIKLIKINLSEKENIDETDKIENFVVEFTYSTSLELYKLIAFLASDIESYQVSQHGDVGGFWIIDDKIPCSVVGYNFKNLNMFLSIVEKQTLIENMLSLKNQFPFKCLTVDNHLKFQNGLMLSSIFFEVEF